MHSYSNKENITFKLTLAKKASKMAIIDDALDSPEHNAYTMGEDVQSGDKDKKSKDRRTHGNPKTTQATPSEVLETMRSFNHMFNKAQE